MIGQTETRDCRVVPATDADGFYIRERRVALEIGRNVSEDRAIALCVRREDAEEIAGLLHERPALLAERDALRAALEKTLAAYETERARRLPGNVSVIEAKYAVEVKHQARKVLSRPGGKS